MKTIYQELSEERKELQDKGLLPEWYTTAGWQILSSKYTTETEKDFRSVAERISKCAAKWTDEPEYYKQKFFDLIWSGDFSCSSPVVANMGTDRGCNVSCSGQYIGDSIYQFYEAQKESAMLSKNGFGTSGYLGAIRPRGSIITSGGKSSGVLPVMKDFVQLSRDVSQGCYDVKTEILTEMGWMSFSDLMYAVVKVAQVHDNGDVDFVLPTDKIAYHYEGNMIAFKDSDNLDLLVTPNHNMTFRNNDSGLYQHCTAEDIEFSHDMFFNNSGFAVGRRYNITDDQKIELQNLLKSDQLAEFFKDIDISELNVVWAIQFIEEVMEWEGTQVTEKEISYSSVNEMNVNVIQAMAILAGYKSVISRETRNDSTVYTTTLTDDCAFDCKNIQKELVEYNDKVYCVTVPTHNLIVRRNGFPVVCGNSTRRGAWAGYIEIDHDDFWEIVNFISVNPDDSNIGWIITDKFVDRLNDGDNEALERYQRAMKIKMVTGKGYFFFVDKVNRLNPQCYKDNGMTVKASNLCIAADSIIEFSCNSDGSNSWKETIESFNEKASLGQFEEQVYVKSYNIETQQFEWKPVHTSIQKTLVDELYELEYDGRTIRCTGDHKILTQRGYVMAKDLTETDELILEQ